MPDQAYETCRCGHSSASHVGERTGAWRTILGPNLRTCRVCTCNGYKAGASRG